MGNAPGGELSVQIAVLLAGVTETLVWVAKQAQNVGNKGRNWKKGEILSAKMRVGLGMLVGV